MYAYIIIASTRSDSCINCIFILLLNVTGSAESSDDHPALLAKVDGKSLGCDLYM